jgi:hypothetical protein
MRWNDDPLGTPRVLPPLAWSLDEAGALIDRLLRITVMDHMVLARTRQLVEMAERARMLELPGTGDPRESMDQLLAAQADRLAEYRKASRVKLDGKEAVTADAIVGTVTGILAAIPGAQIAAAAIAAVYALGRFLAQFLPLAVGYDTDIWGRVEPSIWPATIWDKPEEQMPTPPTSEYPENMIAFPDRPWLDPDRAWQVRLAEVPAPIQLPDTGAPPPDTGLSKGGDGGVQAPTAGIPTWVKVTGVVAAGGLAWWYFTRKAK